MAYNCSKQRKISSWSLSLSMMAFKIKLIYVQGCEKRNPKQVHQYGPNFRSRNFDIVILDSTSICIELHLILDSNYLSSFKTTFLHLFLRSIFMSLILPLDMYQTQLRSTQFTSKVRFVKRLANYIDNDPKKDEGSN